MPEKRLFGMSNLLILQFTKQDRTRAWHACQAWCSGYHTWLPLWRTQVKITPRPGFKSSLLSFLLVCRTSKIALSRRLHSPILLTINYSCLDYNKIVTNKIAGHKITEIYCRINFIEIESFKFIFKYRYDCLKVKIIEDCLITAKSKFN